MVSVIEKKLLEYIYTGTNVFRKRLDINNSNNYKSSEIVLDKKKLFIDLSIIYRADQKTGIQRVVRAIYADLLNNPPCGYQIIPVVATHNIEYKRLLINSIFEPVVGLQNITAEIIDPKAGDIFLGLDLTTSILPRWVDQLIRWKSLGVKFFIIVYDLLPVSSPEWFENQTTRNFYRWLYSIALLADDIACISNTVKDEIVTWFSQKYGINDIEPKIHVLPMGCDIKSSIPTYGIPYAADGILSEIKKRPTAIMVGTLEPRKAHHDVIEAFEEIWSKVNDSDYGLIIVGRLGWKTYSLIQKIKKSPFLGTKLIWIENASDEYLNEIYKISHGLIAASYNEGLGLPILEAINSNKPVIARDIDVFREIKHDAITYFRKCASRHELAQSIAEWFIKDKKYTLYKNTLPRWEMTSAAIASIVESYSINVEN